MKSETACKQLRAHARTFLARFDQASAEVSVFRHEHLSLPALQIELPVDLKLLLVASDGYPTVPPLALATFSAQTSQLQLEWNLSAPAENRLAKALFGHIIPPGPVRQAFGPSPDLLLTLNSSVAEKAGWRRYFSRRLLDSDNLQEELLSRAKGILSNALQKKSVLIAGLGSGGSYTAEVIARAGVRHITIVDHDKVESGNLSRTQYFVGDIGETKAKALTKHLLNINPAARIDAYAMELADLGVTKIKEIIEAADLVLGLTDDPLAQSKLNHFAYFLGKPAIFAGLYRGAKGGEVVLSIPGKTPCLQCSTGTIRDNTQVSPELDYGTGRLNGEMALACDIHHVDTATVKLALSLLMTGIEGSSLPDFARNALERGVNFLLMSMTPKFELLDKVFAATPGQYAYQSIWVNTESNPDCPVCGIERTNPCEFPLRPPRFSVALDDAR